jgi:hypothetical protein
VNSKFTIALQHVFYLSNNSALTDAMSLCRSLIPIPHCNQSESPLTEYFYKIQGCLFDTAPLSSFESKVCSLVIGRLLVLQELEYRNDIFVAGSVSEPSPFVDIQHARDHLPSNHHITGVL